jgi:hypothetical protein
MRLGGVVGDDPATFANRQRSKRSHAEIAERRADVGYRIQRGNYKRNVVFVVGQLLTVGKDY